MRTRPLFLIPALALTLAACAASQATWEKADSDEQQLRSALFWCSRQEPNSAFIKLGTSEPKERGKTTQTAVDEECMRNKGWTKVAK
ncbi:MAG: hypothetical protein AB7P50_05235 [Alphaproteobacteria bacterium]